LLRGGRYSKGPPIKLVWIWDVWGSGWPLLTGGRYSEVAVSTGLTLWCYIFNITYALVPSFLVKEQQRSSAFSMK